jgi:hypothetical protein
MMRVVLGGDVEEIFKFIDGRDVLPDDFLPDKSRTWIESIHCLPSLIYRS